MRPLKVCLVTGMLVLLSACGGGPTDPNTGMGDDDDMMLTGGPVPSASLPRELAPSQPERG
jgi:hypothetical protein